MNKSSWCISGAIDEIHWPSKKNHKTSWTGSYQLDPRWHFFFFISNTLAINRKSINLFLALSFNSILNFYKAIQIISWFYFFLPTVLEYYVKVKNFWYFQHSRKAFYIFNISIYLLSGCLNCLVTTCWMYVEIVWYIRRR